MTDLARLIEKLEAASEGSRELDARIKIALDNPAFMVDGGSWDGKVKATFQPASEALADWPWGDKSGDEAVAMQLGAPHYTTFLDAALALVPEDPANKGKPMLWSVTYDEDGVGGERGYIAGLGKGYHDPQYIYGHSVVNPALALCIASLKSRAALADKS